MQKALCSHMKKCNLVNKSHDRFKVDIEPDFKVDIEPDFKVQLEDFKVQLEDFKVQLKDLKLQLELKLQEQERHHKIDTVRYKSQIDALQLQVRDASIEGAVDMFSLPQETTKEVLAHLYDTDRLSGSSIMTDFVQSNLFFENRGMLDKSRRTCDMAGMFKTNESVSLRIENAIDAFKKGK
jgi:hypothetical protein